MSGAVRRPLTRRTALATAMLLLLGLTPAAFAVGSAPPTLTGRVVDAAGQPVSGADVVAVPAGGGDGTGARSDSSGAFAITAPVGSYEVYASPADLDPVHHVRSLDVPATVTSETTATSVGDVPLRLPTHVVRVLRPDDTPVRDALVMPSPTASSTSSTQAVAEQTDSQGYAGVLLPDGPWELAARALPSADPPLAESAAVPVESTGTPTASADVLTLRLRAPTVAGVVSSPTGTPVGEASVRLVQSGTGDQDYTSSDSQGRFAFAPPRGAQVSVLADPPSDAPYGWVTGKTDLVVPTSGVGDGNVALGVANVTGTLVDPDNRPIPNANVRLGDDAYDFTDSQGRFGFTAPDGNTTLQGFPSYSNNPAHLVESATVPVAVPTDGPVTVRLRAPNVTGQVFMPGGTTAAVGGYVYASKSDSTASGADDVASSSVGSDGFYGLLLSDGPWTLTANPPYPGNPWEAQRVTAPVTVTGGTATGPTMTLATPTATVLALTADGVPAPRAEVQFDPLGSDQSVYDSADDDGRVGAVLAPGGYRVLVRPPFGFSTEVPSDLAVIGSMTVPATGAAPRLTLTMRDRASLPWSSDLVSVTAAGVVPNGRSDQPSLSADATKVAFRSSANNLGTGAASVGVDRIYLRDLNTGATTFVSAPDATLGSAEPSLAGDGSAVAFSSYDDGLVAGDDEGRQDVFVRTLTGGAIRRVTAGADGDSWAPSLSNNGATLAFITAAPSLLAAGAVSGLMLATGTAAPVLISDPDVTNAVDRAVVSADGTAVYYVGRNAGDAAWGVYRYDVGTTETAAVASLGINPGTTLSVSADGRTVTFLVPDDDNPQVQRATVGSAPAAVTLDATPYGGDSSPSIPAVSADGSTLFYSASPVDTASDQLFVRNLTAGGTELATPGYEGLGAVGSPIAMAPSADGSAVAFAYEGVDPDGVERSDNTSQIYLGRLRNDTAPPTWPAGSQLTPGATGTTLASMSWPAATDDARVAAYQVQAGTREPIRVSGTSRTYTFTQLTPGTTYALSVRPIDTAGNIGDALTASTTTGTTTPTAAGPLLAVTGQDGSVALEWDPDAAATEYIVQRSTGNGALTELTRVPAGTTSYVDRSTQAGAVHSYRIVSVTPDGDRTHTVTATPDAIPALFATALSSTVPVVRAGLAQLGSDMSFAFSGSPRRAVSLDVTWENAAGPQQTVLPLTETAAGSGQYRGIFRLAEGVQRVVAATASVTDGQGGSATASTSRLPIAVSGALRVALSGDSVPGVVLELSSAAAASAFRRTPGGEPLLLPVAPADDWRVRAIGSEESEAGRAEDQAVTAGRITDVAVALTAPRRVVIRYQLADGTPISGMSGALTRGDNGESLPASGSDGMADTGLRLKGADPYVLRTTAYTAELYQPVPDQQVTPTLDATPTVVTVTPYPVVELRGTVKKSTGAALPGAEVSLLQVLDGRSRRSSTTTADDGTWSLRGTTGPGTLVAGGSGESRRTELADVATAGDQALVLDPPTTYVVDLRLMTRQPGQAQFVGPASLDWRTAVHYRLNVTGPGGGGYYAGARSPTPGAPATLYTFRGTPGQEVKACADGVEIGLPANCASIVLAEATTPTLELRLGAGESVSFNNPIAAGMTMRLLARAADGSLSPVGTDRFSWKTMPTVALPRPGDYVLQVTRGWPYGTSATAFSAAADEQVSLGELAFQSTGPFADLKRNAITASRGTALPGGTIALRAAYGSSATEVLPGAVLRVDVPTGTTLVPDSTTVGGAAITGTPGDGFVDLPLGDIPADGGGVATWVLRLTPDMAAPAVLGSASVRSGVLSAALPTVSVPVSQVTLDAPSLTSSLDVPVSGRAPAGASVEIADAVGLLGTAVAGPGGFWTSSVRLRDTGQSQRVLLHAVSGAQRSTGVGVNYDASAPVLTDLALRQDDSNFPQGREVHIDPRAGVGRFPFVFVPGQDMIVTTTFTNPSRVRDVVVRVGAFSAPGVLTDGVFVARLRNTDGRGDISVDYGTVPAPMTYTPRTEAQARAALPPAVSDYVLPLDGDPTTTENGVSRLHVQPTLPSAGDAAKLDVDVTLEDAPDYVPTEEESAAANDGIPAYGTTTETLGDGTVVLTTYIEKSRLSGPTQVSALRRAGSTRIVAKSVASAGKALMKLVMKVKPDQVEAGITLGSGGVGGYNTVAGNNYASIDDLYPLLAYCDASKRARFTDEIDTERRRQLAQDTISMGVQILAGIGATAVLPGVGTAAGMAAAGYITDQVLNHVSAGKIKILAARIKAACKKPDDPDDEGDGDGGDNGSAPIASPVWIHDPSGYVYEGTRANRVSGATATLLQKVDGSWVSWDADWFGQKNPLITTGAGRYGWDVPEGDWKVVWTKDGYAPGASRELRVLPPRFDIDHNMAQLAAPNVTSVAASADAATVVATFDRPMRVASVTADSAAVTVAGAAVDGTWTAVAPSAGEAADGSAAGPVASSFTFTPATAFSPASTARIGFGDGLQDYDGRALGAGVSREVGVGGSVSTGGSSGGSPGGSSPLPSALPSASPSPTGSPAPGSGDSASASAPGRYTPLATAVRALDTRAAGTRRSGEITVRLPESVPAEATAVLLNVTVTGAVASGHVVLYPAGTAKPATSSVNFVPGATQANLVLTRLGPNREVVAFVQGGPAHVIVDVVGSYVAAQPTGVMRRVGTAVRRVAGLAGAPHVGVVATASKRLLDTRDGTGAPAGRRTTAVTVKLPASVPAEAKAVLLNVTALGASRAAHVTAYPTGSAKPGTSNVNVSPGRTQANLVLVQIGADRSVTLAPSSGPLHLIADLVGYQLGPEPALPPQRVMDSRIGLGTRAGLKSGAVALRLPDSLPSAVRTVVLNVTVVGSVGNGHVTAYPASSSKPATSNVNYGRGQTQANLVVVPVGSNRSVILDVYGAATNLVVDLVGAHTE